MLNDKTEKSRKAAAVAKVRILEETFDLLLDGRLLDLRKISRIRRGCVNLHRLAGKIAKRVYND
jgi:hypothetical protein